MTSVKSVAAWLDRPQKIAVITGAGMSTESGIPDFRSAEGLYSEETGRGISMEDVLSHSFFKAHPQKFYRLYYEKLLFPDARPNPGHYFLKELEVQGHTVTIITQNIDGLHQKAGSQHVLELHGNAGRVVTASGMRADIKEAALTEKGLEVNGEWARPAITLYGEALDRTVLEQSIQAVREADILLVMGTSLNVYPAAALIYDYSGQKSALVNKGKTPSDRLFTLWSLTVRSVSG
ncbi:MAG: NAD-dependent protein deacylase [Alkalibacterium sp.]|nr:NAD-dependent protein deacylase [Alkalibacterium sp.]